MSDKSFGAKQINLIGIGTPTIESPNNLNINATTVAISTDVTIGGQVQSDLKINQPYSVGIGTTVTTAKLTVDGDINLTTGIITATSGIITYYGDGSNLTGVVTSIIAGNNISVSNSSGQVSISASPSTSPTPTRTTVSGTTSTISPNSAVNLDITGYKAYTLLKITVSGPSWVVLYTDTNSRSNDSSRDSLTDPLPGSGIIAEIYTETTGSSTFLMSPGVIGWNNSSPISNTIFAKVKNTGLSSAAITVTLTVIPMEE